MKGQSTCQWLVIGSTELCGKSCLGDHCKIHLARLRRSSGTQPCMECGKGVKIDSGYVWTAVTIKLGCVPGKGIIGLLWSSLNVWRPSKFSFRDFLSVIYTHLELWYHKAQIRAWQRSHRAFMVEFIRLAASKFSFRDFFII